MKNESLPSSLPCRWGLGRTLAPSSFCLMEPLHLSVIHRSLSELYFLQNQALNKDCLFWTFAKLLHGCWGRFAHGKGEGWGWGLCELWGWCKILRIFKFLSCSSFLNFSVTSLFMFFLHSPQFEFQLCNITATKDYKIYQVRKIWRARTKTRGCPHSPGENSKAPLSFVFFFFSLTFYWF